MAPFVISMLGLACFSLLVLWLNAARERKDYSLSYEDAWNSLEVSHTERASLESQLAEQGELIQAYIKQARSLRTALMEMRQQKADILADLEALVQQNFLGGEQEKRPRQDQGIDPDKAECFTWDSDDTPLEHGFLPEKREAVDLQA